VSKKTILKMVCKECYEELKNIIKEKSLEIYAGGNIECEWCEKQIKKFDKYIQIYKEKQ